MFALYLAFVIFPDDNLENLIPNLDPQTTSLVQQCLHLPYEWGGTFTVGETENLVLFNYGVDCSGLTQSFILAITNNRVRIPRTTSQLYSRALVFEPSRSDLKRFDIVLFRVGGSGSGLHAGVYLGGPRKAILMAFKPTRPTGLIFLDGSTPESRWWARRLTVIYRPTLPTSLQSDLSQAGVRP